MRTQPLEVLDARAVELISLARSSGMDPTPILGVRSIFGERLSSNIEFLQAVSDAMQTLSTDGVRVSLRRYIARSH
jgi:mannitol-1-phosphate/altronate dehydrogenase